jgi:hypothetical protein
MSACRNVERRTDEEIWREFSKSLQKRHVLSALREKGAETYLLLNFRRFGLCLANSGIWRFMNASNIGTVNAVSPYL